MIDPTHLLIWHELKVLPVHPRQLNLVKHGSTLGDALQGKALGQFVRLQSKQRRPREEEENVRQSGSLSFRRREKCNTRLLTRLVPNIKWPLFTVSKLPPKFEQEHLCMGACVCMGLNAGHCALVYIYTAVLVE